MAVIDKRREWGGLYAANYSRANLLIPEGTEITLDDYQVLKTPERVTIIAGLLVWSIPRSVTPPGNFGVFEIIDVESGAVAATANVNASFGNGGISGGSIVQFERGFEVYWRPDSTMFPGPMPCDLRLHFGWQDSDLTDGERYAGILQPFKW